MSKAIAILFFIQSLYSAEEEGLILLENPKDKDIKVWVEPVSKVKWYSLGPGEKSSFPVASTEKTWWQVMVKERDFHFEYRVGEHVMKINSKYMKYDSFRNEDPYWLGNEGMKSEDLVAEKKICLKTALCDFGYPLQSLRSNPHQSNSDIVGNIQLLLCEVTRTGWPGFILWATRE